jgi:hypothetical protein
MMMDIQKRLVHLEDARSPDFTDLLFGRSQDAYLQAFFNHDLHTPSVVPPPFPL